MSRCNCADEPLYIAMRAHTHTDNKTTLKEEMWQPLGKCSKYYYYTQRVRFLLLFLIVQTTRSRTIKKVQKKSAMWTTTRVKRKQKFIQGQKMFEIIRLNKAKVLLITKDTIVSCSRSFYLLSYFCFAIAQKI